MSNLEENPFLLTQIIEVPGKWFSIDFHVHSPASYDFEGPTEKTQERERYIWLMEQAYKEKLDTIVITDHNSIKGYYLLLDIKNDLETTERTLSNLNLPLPEDIEKRLDLFKKVIFLPGVELDTTLGVHYLVIFDPTSSPNEINGFLDRAGYPMTKRSSETSSRFAAWGTQETCREANKMGAIVIAAHVDSTSGIFEVTKELAGHVRIAAFCDDGLYAMEFKNPIARAQIEHYLASPDYLRKTRLAFVQSSDFHGHANQTIGQRKTWIRLDETAREPSAIFHMLKQILRNPDEYVSAPSRPELREILQKLLERKYPSIRSLDTNDIDVLLKYVCAFANGAGGTIIIGKTNEGSWVGIDGQDSKSIGEQIAALIREKIKPNFRFNLEIYKYYSNKFIATLRVKANSQLTALSDEKVFIIHNGKPKQATVDQIVKIAEEHLIRRHKNLSITSRIHNLARKLEGVQDSLDILPLVLRVTANSQLMEELFPEPTKGGTSNIELLEGVDMPGNGYRAGNIISLTPCKPRLKDQYRRITSPTGILTKENEGFNKLPVYSGYKIIIVPEGAVHFDVQDNIRIVCEDFPPLILSPDNDFKGPHLLYVVSYLRSSLAIWYAERCLGSCNFHDRKILSRLPIPLPTSADIEKKVVELTEDLINKEFEFLDKEKTLLQSNPAYSKGIIARHKLPEDALAVPPNDDALKTFIECLEIFAQSHNDQAAEVMRQIDNEFFQMLEIGKNDKEMIENCLPVLEISTLKS